MTRTLPNLLTLLRLVAAPGLALLFVAFDRPLADALALALFVIASATDYVDGWLARRWAQTTEFGRMLDPIADKAMVVVALSILLSLTGPNWALLIPVTVILLREISVSGLREFLAGEATIPVTRLAKWKTSVQMTAIAALFLAGIADERVNALYYELPPDLFDAILLGEADDVGGLRLWSFVAPGLALTGFALIWTAALLTAITGWDYFARGLAHIRRVEKT